MPNIAQDNHTRQRASLRVVDGDKSPVGRPPGQPRTGGRKKGVPNKVTRNVREMILKRGKPVELLCDVSRGKKIRIGPQAGPGEPEYYYPTPADRIAAARDLMPYVASKMQQLTGANEQPLIPGSGLDTEVDRRSLARAILNVLMQSDTVPECLLNIAENDPGLGKHQKSDPSDGSVAVALDGEASDVSPESQDCEVGEYLEDIPQVEACPVGDLGHHIELLYRASDGRGKWAIYDEKGIEHTKMWGKEAARKACEQLISEGQITR